MFSNGDAHIKRYYPLLAVGDAINTSSKYIKKQMFAPDDESRPDGSICT